MVLPVLAGREESIEVNKAGNKIGADELPSVTQLFTEDYMVDFLLDNTLGAWHAGKVLAANPKLAETAQTEDELRQAVALADCTWKYLRFVQTKDGKWTPGRRHVRRLAQDNSRRSGARPVHGKRAFRGGDV
jgi:hypothetical protein